MYLWIVLLIILVVIIFLRNSIVRAKNQVEEAKSAVDVYLKKRYDLIPNLVNLIKAYLKYEKMLLISLLQLKKQLVLLGEEFDFKRFKMENKLSENIKKTFYLLEKYPSIKANKHFFLLQKELVDIEGNLRAARENYNKAVELFKNKIKVFPFNIVAKFMKLPEYEYFKF